MPGATKARRVAAPTPIRRDLLEDTVWTEVPRWLEDPALIQAELTRRLEAARTSDPAKQNQDRIMRELLQTQRRAERLLTAYQEDLWSLDELRRRMPELRQRESRLKAKLDSLSAQLADQASYMRFAHTLGEFLERLRTQTQGLGVLERQRVVRHACQGSRRRQRQHCDPAFDSDLESPLRRTRGIARSAHACRWR
jgi:site-specific DNA recombinase